MPGTMGSDMSGTDREPLGVYEVPLEDMTDEEITALALEIATAMGQKFLEWEQAHPEG